MALSNFSISVLFHFVFIALIGAFSFVVEEDVLPMVTNRISLNYLGAMPTEISRVVPEVKKELEPSPVVTEVETEIPTPIIEPVKKVKKQIKKIQTKTVSTVPVILDVPKPIIQEEQIAQQDFSRQDIVAQNEIQARYRDVFMAKILSEKSYPERARRRGIEGKGLVLVVINSLGGIKAITLLESAGSNLLDDEILSMIRRAAPFPKLPSHLSEFSAKLPVAFDLAN